MTEDSTARLYEDSRDLGLDTLARLVREETEALLDVLPDALSRQWTASPIPRPRDDTTQRASGDRSDPTADIALDARRLRVRETVRASEDVLRDAAVALRGVRLAVERAVARFDGED